MGKLLLNGLHQAEYIFITTDTQAVIKLAPSPLLDSFTTGSLVRLWLQHPGQQKLRPFAEEGSSMQRVGSVQMGRTEESSSSYSEESSSSSSEVGNSGSEGNSNGSEESSSSSSSILAFNRTAFQMPVLDPSPPLSVVLAVQPLGSDSIPLGDPVSEESNSAGGARSSHSGFKVGAFLGPPISGSIFRIITDLPVIFYLMDFCGLGGGPVATEQVGACMSDACTAVLPPA